MPELMSSSEEFPTSRETVIKLLDTYGMGHSEARDAMRCYTDQCHAEADREVAADPINPDTPNRANIKAEIKIASLYFETVVYKDYGREALEELLQNASFNASTQDLAEEIENLLL